MRKLYSPATLEAAIVLATSAAVDSALAGAASSGSTPTARAHCLLLAVMAVAAEALFASSFRTMYRQRDAPSPGLALGALAVPWTAAAVATARLRQGLPTLFPLLCLRGAIFSSALCLGFLAQRAAATAAPAETEAPARSSNTAITAEPPRAPPVDVWRLSLLAGALAAVGASAGGSSRESIYFWVAAAAVASVVALHAVATLLPRTFTLGEAIAAIQGVIVLAALLGAQHVSAGSPLSSSIQLSEHALFTVTLVFWTISISFAISGLLRAARAPQSTRTTRRACVSAAATTAAIGAALAARPAVWTVQYALSDPVRVKVVGWWVALMAVALPAMLGAARSHALPNIVLRKGYHLLAVSLFLPALLAQPQLLGVALAAAFSLLAALEVARTAGIPGVSTRVHAYMASFVDSRDSGALFVTHFTLLLGLAAPVWLAGACGGGSSSGGGGGARLYCALAGIVTTGLGDAAASVVGSAWGRVPVAPGSRKTVEGTAAGWATSMIAWVAMVWAGAVPPPRWAGGSGEVAGWVALGAATALSSALEAATDQLDNMFGPLQYFALLLCMLR